MAIGDVPCPPVAVFGLSVLASNRRGGRSPTSWPSAPVSAAVPLAANLAGAALFPRARRALAGPRGIAGTNRVAGGPRIAVGLAIPLL